MPLPLLECITSCTCVRASMACRTMQLPATYSTTPSSSTCTPSLTSTRSPKTCLRCKAASLMSATELCAHITRSVHAIATMCLPHCTRRHLKSFARHRVRELSEHPATGSRRGTRTSAPELPPSTWSVYLHVPLADRARPRTESRCLCVVVSVARPQITCGDSVLDTLGLSTQTSCEFAA